MPIDNGECYHADGELRVQRKVMTERFCQFMGDLPRKSCLGNWLFGKSGDLAQEVNSLLGK